MPDFHLFDWNITVLVIVGNCLCISLHPRLLEKRFPYLTLYCIRKKNLLVQGFMFVSTLLCSLASGSSHREIKVISRGPSCVQTCSEMVQCDH